MMVISAENLFNRYGQVMLLTNTIGTVVEGGADYGLIALLSVVVTLWAATNLLINKFLKFEKC